jgi:hypothetical protein
MGDAAQQLPPEKRTVEEKPAETPDTEAAPLSQNAVAQTEATAGPVVDKSEKTVENSEPKISREDQMATAPGFIPRHFAAAMDKLTARADSKNEPRWIISDAGNDPFSTTLDGNFVITDLTGTEHRFKIARIANFYFQPLLAEPERIDLFVWEKGDDHPRARHPVYAGTFHYKSGVAAKLDMRKKELGIG